LNDVDTNILRGGPARRVIGLTGASGSGKSEAARILSGLGAYIIDADKVAREVTDRRETMDELVREFGGWIVGPRGRFNRADASKRAFSDGVFLKRLTEITHKYIIKEIYGRVESFITDPAPGAIVIDAPIPVEKGFLDISDAVWVISTSRAVRLERVMARDRIARDAAEARFASQLSDAEYEKLADVVIYNNGGPENLEAEVALQYRMFCRGRGK